MIRTLLLGGAILMALSTPALSEDQCVAPKSPSIPDGSKATPTQIVAAQDDIKAFADASDKFQSCLQAEMGRQRSLATQNNSEMDPKIQADLNAKGLAQRQDAQKVAAAWGVAVDAFNKAQTRKQSGSRPAASGGGGYGGGGYGGGGYGSSRY